MAQGKAEDAGGLTPAKDDNTALCHFGHRTLPISSVSTIKHSIRWRAALYRFRVFITRSISRLASRRAEASRLS